MMEYERHRRAMRRKHRIQAVIAWAVLLVVAFLTLLGLWSLLIIVMAALS